MGATIDRDGVPIAWESHGDGTPPVLLLPAWAIVHSRLWKLQVPYLARHHRVVTFDPRGNGASGRPDRPEAYADAEYVADALAVLDAAGIDKALLVGLSSGGRWALQLAAAHPERVLELLLIAPSVPLREAPAKHDSAYWSKDYRRFLDAFFGEMFVEPHSTRQIEDGVEWGLEIGPETLSLTVAAEEPERDWQALCQQVSCPVTVVHGRRDRIVPYRVGAEVAKLTGGELIPLDESGHGPHARRPVYFNELIHDTARRVAGHNGRRSPRRNGRRALFLSSPIGLGHARRDLAIASELRERVPDLKIDWLAQEPTSAVLRAAGERVHPMSAHLAAEADHIDAWRGDHELHVFESIRRMDEILVANYMVFRDLTRAQRYDLWICDEAWEVDYHLHENPGDKRAPYAWLSDFVGWLPLPEHGEREAYLAADLNAEMIGHVEGPDAVRDLALFVGEPGDIVPDDFGPGLPSIREWTERHYEFTGQISEVGPAPPGGDAPLCLVTAGGSGVGEALLHRAVAALPELRRRVPGARMLVVCGPRIDPRRLPTAEGLEVVGYIPEIPACDVALAHGGLSTGMERVAAGTPFVSVPLRGHFEQMRHVRHRLERHGHTRTVLPDEATPERLAAELAAALQAPPAYLPVSDGGAAFAAERLAALL